MDLQNLSYALVQLAHNFGAAAIVGIAWFGWQHVPQAPARLAGWLALAWAVQIVSGATFGATSLYYYGRLPDIHGIAIVALAIKVIAALLGLVLALIYIGRTRAVVGQAPTRAWLLQTVLGIIALSAAAFLRWFS